MQESEFLKKLEMRRGRIDEIDGQLLKLLVARLQVVEEVGELKAEYGLQGSYIRPAREAIMLRKLLREAKLLGLPQMMVASLWRLLIGTATAHESPLNVVVRDGDPQAGFAAIQYFSELVPQNFGKDGEFWQSGNAHSIFILPYDLGLELWRDMPEHLQVFAHIPFYIGGSREAAPKFLAAAHIEAEASGDDISLFYDENNGMLCEVAGFMRQNSPTQKFIGAYAKPFVDCG